MRRAALALTLIAGLHVSAALASDARGRRTATRSCTQWVKHADGIDAFVTLEVDRSHRQLKRELLLRTREYWVRWSFPDHVFDSGRRPDEFGPASTEIPTEVRFPVTVLLVFGDQVALRRALAGPNSTFMYRYSASNRTIARPGVSVHAGSGEIASPFGASRLDLVVHSAEGAEIVRKALTVPDWGRLRLELAQAFETVEDERRRNACRASYVVVGH